MQINSPIQIGCKIHIPTYWARIPFVNGATAPPEVSTDLITESERFASFEGWVAGNYVLRRAQGETRPRRRLENTTAKSPQASMGQQDEKFKNYCLVKSQRSFFSIRGKNNKCLLRHWQWIRKLARPSGWLRRRVWSNLKRCEKLFVRLETVYLRNLMMQAQNTGVTSPILFRSPWRNCTRNEITHP